MLHRSITRAVHLLDKLIEAIGLGDYLYVTFHPSMTRTAAWRDSVGCLNIHCLGFELVAYWPRSRAART